MIYDTPAKAETYLAMRKTIYLPRYTRGEGGIIKHQSHPKSTGVDAFKYKMFFCHSSSNSCNECMLVAKGIASETIPHEITNKEDDHFYTTQYNYFQF